MIFPYSVLITSKTRSLGSKSTLGSLSPKVFMGLGFRAYGLGHWTSTFTNILPTFDYKEHCISE